MQFSGNVAADKTLKMSRSERSRFDAYVATLSGPVVLTVETPAQRRSKASNDYYWSVVVEFFREQWSRERGRPYAKEDAHEVLVQWILGFELGPHGTRVRKRTRDLTQQDFSRLIEDAKQMAWQDYRSRIPEPNEDAS
jgi:hypothetical protein